MNCPKCNATGLPDEAKFCPNCGSKLSKPIPAKNTISKGALLLLCVLLFFLIYIIIFVLFGVVLSIDSSWKTVTPVSIIITIILGFILNRINK